MSMLQSSTRVVLSETYGVEKGDIELLGIDQTVSSPKGYADKMDYTGLFSLTKGEDKIYVKCDPYYARSFLEVNEDRANSFLDKCLSSKGSSCSPDFVPKNTELWLSKSKFEAMGLTIQNPFSVFILRVNQDGEFNGLHFKKGDFIRYCRGSYFDDFPEELVSHIHIYSGLGERLAPSGAWSNSPFSHGWTRH